MFIDPIDKIGKRAYHRPMTNPARPIADFDDEAAEIAALTRAVEKARANKRGVPHEEMRIWVLELADGNFDAPPPVAREL